MAFHFHVVTDVLCGLCRYCCEKSPEAIRILLPDATSPAVSPVKQCRCDDNAV